MARVPQRLRHLPHHRRLRRLCLALMASPAAPRPPAAQARAPSPPQRAPPRSRAPCCCRRAPSCTVVAPRRTFHPPVLLLQAPACAPTLSTSAVEIDTRLCFETSHLLWNLLFVVEAPRSPLPYRVCLFRRPAAAICHAAISNAATVLHRVLSQQTQRMPARACGRLGAGWLHP